MDNKSNFKAYEQICIGFVAIMTGIIVAYISIIGPLYLNFVTYKSSASGVFQFIGQDLLNVLFVAPLLIISGIFLLLKKPNGVSLLALMPLYLIYYGLSYAIGIEWSDASLFGNSESNIYLYIIIVVNSLLILLYCVENMEHREMKFSKRSLIIYSTLASILTVLFALSYIQAINQNLTVPTEEYLSAPALFWFVKTFDLCFSIPLMGISIYLLWTRPLKSYLMQMLSYGFFITLTSAVNSMAIVMYFKGDPTYSMSAHVLFICLEIISIIGFIFIIRSAKRVSGGFKLE